jgi:hypothetical protein
VANPVSRSTTANKVVYGRTLTEVNLLSMILFGIRLAEPKPKSKKMSPTDLVEEEEKAEAEVEVEPRSQKEEENFGKRTSKIHTCYRAMLLSLMIFLIRWVTQVLQPTHV